MTVLLLSLILHSINPSLMPMWVVVFVLVIHALGQIIAHSD